MATVQSSNASSTTTTRTDSTPSPSLLSLNTADLHPAWRAPPLEEDPEDHQDVTNTDNHSSPSSAALLAILDIEEIDPNLYRGSSPQHPRWSRIFGGQTVAQAMVAAARTIPPPYIIHSLHSYFLRAGDDSIPILYQVERLRDGTSFISRRVTAIQRGRPIFIGMMSFHKIETGALEHQDTMSIVPPPSQLPSLIETMRQWAADDRLLYKTRQGILRSSSFPYPIDIRRVDNYNLTQRLTPTPTATQRCWMRALGYMGESLILHQCALAYMSDWSLLETALLPHGIHSYQNTPERSIEMASLGQRDSFRHTNHHIYIY